MMENVKTVIPFSKPVIMLIKFLPVSVKFHMYSTYTY